MSSVSCNTTILHFGQMEEYYEVHSAPSQSRTQSPSPDDGEDVDDFDHHRNHLVSQAVRHEGWRSEMARYLTDIPEDISKDTDIVIWWSVRNYFLVSSL
jgi:hypothetical protein